MTRSAAPGLLIAFAVLIAGLLLAFTVGRYPVGLGDLFDVIAAKLTGRAAACPPRSRTSSCRCAGRACWRPCWSARRWRWPAPRSRACFAIRWCRRTFWARRPARRSARCSASSFRSACSRSRPSRSSADLIAVAAVYAIGSAVRSRDPMLVLVLTGVVVGALLGAGVGLVKYLADPYNQLPAMTFWLLGSLAATASPICVPLFGPVALGTLVLVALRWRMNVMSLPDEEARALGVADRAAAHRDRRGGDAGHLGERRDRRHHRLGRAGGAASRALAGRAGFRAAPPGRGAARRRLPAGDRHACAHRGADRDSAGHPDRVGRHAVLHLAAGQRVRGRWS